MSLDQHHAREDPFGPSPDGRYFIAFPTHERTLSRMIAAVHASSPLQTLISHTGLGKTSLLERLCDALPRYRRWAFRMHIKCTDSEFYRFALAELGGQPDDVDVQELRERLVALTAKLQRGSDGFLLIFDEAQNLSDSVLSELAELVERSPAKPQIILSGQPRLAEMLRSPRHVRLRNSIAGEHTLSALSTGEVMTYIPQRLCVAGYRSTVFSDEAMKVIADVSHGVPRVINNICWTVMSKGETALPSSADDVRQALRGMNLPPSEQAAIPSLVSPGHQPMPAPVAKEETSPMIIADALQDWLRNLVRWKGTAGELLAQLSGVEGAGGAARMSPRELLDRLVSERTALGRRGIDVEVSDRQGLPPLISLQFDPAKVLMPETAPLTESATLPVDQPLPAEPKQSRPSRWRTIHLWTLGMVLVAAGVAISVRGSEESAAARHSQPVEPVPVSSKVPQQASSATIASERLSAEAGDPAAQRHLALKYQHGDGVRQDNGEALNWLRKAAGKRDGESQYLLARALADTDKLEAYKWFVLSHAAGWQQSLPEIQRLTPQLSRADIGKVRYQVALAYAQGEGAPLDLTQAYIWMTLAKAAGVLDSDQQLHRIAQRMSSEEIAGASQKADAWLTRIREPLVR